MVCEEGGVHKVSRCPTVDESDDGDRGEGVLEELDGNGELAGSGMGGGW